MADSLWWARAHEVNSVWLTDWPVWNRVPSRSRSNDSSLDVSLPCQSKRYSVLDPKSPPSPGVSVMARKPRWARSTVVAANAVGVTVP